MALYTKPQFCELLGIDSSYLSTYIRRGKVIVQGDFIDGELSDNKTFIDSRLQNQKKKLEKAPAPAPKKKVAAPVTPPPLERVTIEEDEIPDFTLDQLEKMAANKLDQEKIRIQILKTQEELQVTRIKKLKMLGEIIPVELVHDIFQQHFKDIDDAFNQGANQIAAIMVKQLGGTRSDLADIRADITAIINKKIASAKEASENEIKNIVKEYSESKGRGEK